VTREKPFAYSIFFISFALHAVGICWLFSEKAKPAQIKRSEKLVVKTVALDSVSNAKQQIKPTAATAPANCKKKPISKKNKKPPPPPSHKPNPKQKRAREQAKKTIANLLNRKEPCSSGVALKDLAQITPLSTHEPRHTNYYDSLSNQLKNTLVLPEMGTVQLALTIDRNGRLLKLKAESAESEYNKKFVLAALQRMQFPAFDNEFEGESAHTFLVTLENQTCNH